MRSGEAYDRYKSWCRNNKKKELTIKKFKENMINKGYNNKITKKGIIYVGINLIFDESDSD